MDTQYTNALTPDILAGMDKSPLSSIDIAAMSDEARELVREQEEYLRQYPVTALWRQATVGSLTRRGGVVSSGRSGGQVVNSSGELVAFSLVGDEVTYPDGSVATIVSGSGSSISSNGKGYALVGSVLSNGDEIISTPQDIAVLCCHAGETMPDDFLIVVAR